jgi:hypothetical protein
MKQQRSSGRKDCVRFGVRLIFVEILIGFASANGLSQSNTNQALSPDGNGDYVTM